jgi:hypothetical protein
MQSGEIDKDKCRTLKGFNVNSLGCNPGKKDEQRTESTRVRRNDDAMKNQSWLQKIK